MTPDINALTEQARQLLVRQVTVDRIEACIGLGIGIGLVALAVWLWRSKLDDNCDGTLLKIGSFGAFLLSLIVIVVNVCVLIELYVNPMYYELHQLLTAAKG